LKMVGNGWMDVLFAWLKLSKIYCRIYLIDPPYTNIHLPLSKMEFFPIFPSFYYIYLYHYFFHFCLEFVRISTFSCSGKKLACSNSAMYSGVQKYCSKH
jgi:hypothetical protein